jgi:23S rRNA pseudouridine2605 synthase
MAKFNSSSGDRKPYKKRSAEGEGERRSFTKKDDSAGGEENLPDGKAGKKSYKAKRSFTRNKDFRATKPKGEKSFTEKKGEKEHRRPFTRDYEKRDGEKRSYGDKKFGDKKSYGDKRSYGDKPRFDKDKKFGEKKSWGDDKPRFDKDKKYGDKPRFDKERKSYSDDKPRFSKDRESGEKKSYGDKAGFDREKKSYSGDKPRFSKDRASGEKKSYGDKPRFNKDRKFGAKKSYGDEKPIYDKSERKNFDNDDTYEKKDSYEKKPRIGSERFEKKESKFATDQKRLKYEELEEGQGFKGSYDKDKFGKSHKEKHSEKIGDGTTRLNKYLAHAGIASRRDADTLIKSGVVKVNGIPITEMGFKVKPGDKVTYGDSAIKNEKKVYLLLNKPKDYITTVDDPQERRTVMDLIAGACKERVYPVGRLDRNTTGLLLLTNDGDLTKKLTHPKHNIKKIYHVSLSKGLKTDDFRSIMEGIELEDGPIKADDIAFVGEGKKEVGIEVHSGRNRIVRRIFEHLGYEVEKLDRVSFAGLTKKDLPRGKYRFLTQKEVGFLQMIG